MRVRRILWSWVLWAALAALAAAAGDWPWAVGLASIAVVTYLLAPMEWPPTYGLEHELAVEEPAFISSVVGTTGMPFLHGNDVRLLNNGAEFYPAMLEAIQSAERSLTIEAYIYWDGEIGLQFAEALAERARAGVPVKILLDAVGSSWIGSTILELLEKGGCQLAWFNPIHWYTIGRFNYRTHRKSLIIDGRIGFTGGAGIADHWQGHAEDKDHWRDMQVRVEGPGALPLQTGFAQNWLQTTGELVSGPAYFPETTTEAGPVAVQTVLSSPSTGASTVRVLYYLSIVCARHSVWIANPYFIPDGAAIDTLVAARRRGVDVKVIVSGRHNDNWLARHNSVRLFGPLLEAGIEIYEYNRTMLHHKIMVVDEAWATIGTTNFDNRSFAFNEESNVSFTEPRLVGELKQSFLDDLSASDRVTLDRWRSRGLVSRTSELLASFLQDQV
jgi:cardiolipin synthase A/B